MPLTHTQYLFILQQLGFKPAYAFALAGLSEAAHGDADLDRALQAYLDVEATVIAGIERLTTTSVPQELIDALERKVQFIQRRVREARREAASGVLQAAWEEMQRIQARVAQEPELSSLVDDARERHRPLQERPIVRSEAERIKTTLIDAAEGHTDQHEFAQARRLLAMVEPACRTAREQADSFDLLFAQAGAELARCQSDMLAVEVHTVQKSLLDASTAAAERSDLPGARDLASEAIRFCRSAAQVKLKAHRVFDGQSLDEVTKPLLLLMRHEESTAFQTEIAELMRRLDSLREAVAAGLSMTKTKRLVIKEMSTLSREAEQIDSDATVLGKRADRHRANRRSRLRVEATIRQLREAPPLDSNEVIAPDLDAMVQDVAEAERLAASRLYGEADSAVSRAWKRHAEAASRKEAHARYVDGVTSLEPKVAALPDTSGEATDAQCLRDLLASARELAAEPGRDYAAACKLLDRVGRHCESIDQSRAAAVQDEDAARVVATLRGGSAEAAVVQARQLIDERGGAGAAGMSPPMQRFSSLIESIDSTPEAAQGLLAAAADAYLLDAQLRHLQDAFRARLDEEVLPALETIDRRNPIARQRADQITATLEIARHDAMIHCYAAAANKLDGAVQQIADVREFLTRRRTLDDLSVKVKALALPAPGVAADLTTLYELLGRLDADLKRQDVDFRAFDPELSRATTRYEFLKVHALLVAPAFDESAFGRQMRICCDRPGGSELLDKLMARKDLKFAPRQVMLAIQARFNLMAVIDDHPATPVTLAELRRIYATMASVNHHVLRNESFENLTRTKPDTSSFYDARERLIGISSSAARLDETPGLGDRRELPSRDARLFDTGAAEPKRLEWSMLHELGHSVDDYKVFMQSNGGRPEFGGWKVYGGDVLAVAKEVLAACSIEGVDATDLAKYLNNGTKPPRTTKGWRIVQAWADKVRHTRDPWDKGALCELPLSAGGILVGNRIYQEAYAGKWVSYLEAERRGGVRGYQFRAPEEWFADLFAAGASKLLGPGHPACGWLGDLFTPPAR